MLPPPPPRSNAWTSAHGWIGRKQVDAARAAASSAAAEPTSMSVEEFPLLARLPAGSTSQLPPPNLLAAANSLAATLYSSPQTDPQPRQEPPVTRRAQTDGRGERAPTFEERLAALKPHGRVQRLVQLSEEEKRLLKNALARARYAIQKQVREKAQVFMSDLARYDLPLVQLQLAEFAADPRNFDARKGSMRTRFLALYGTCCHTKFVEPVHGVHNLPLLARALQLCQPARELLRVRIEAAKRMLVEAFTGAHRMGAVEYKPEQTLTQLRISIFRYQRRDGATAKGLEGNGAFMPQLRASKDGVRYTLEFRHQVHIQRYFTAKGNILSYENAAETAAAGALLYFENVSRDELSPYPGRTTCMLHDERFHYLQRLIGCTEIVQVASQLLSIIYDDASKRGVSFLGSALIGSRADGTLFYEVLRVSRLLKDLVTNKTKSGLNGARALVAGTEDFARDCDHEALLWCLGVILCDTTGSNTGTRIVTGEGGSASHFRARVEELTRGADGSQGQHASRIEREYSGAPAHLNSYNSTDSFARSLPPRALCRRAHPD